MFQFAAPKISCFSKRQYPVETSQDHGKVWSFDGTKLTKQSPMNMADELMKEGDIGPRPPARSILCCDWLGFALARRFRVASNSPKRYQ